MLGDRRQNNTGTEPLLDDVQLAQLWQILHSLPADAGLWNGPKVAAWMSELLGRKVSPQRCLHILPNFNSSVRLWPVTNEAIALRVL
ncbi:MULTISPECIES: hypothetical protein [unclassified Nostoc]|uniref:hypothetical protein n=1 Tax=unclassified Nostoc TaxID=2593658 RepID=UPI0025EC3392|nr:hypothetical protein [Nostoc sp. NMS9]